jgi:predicted dehydrogenase
MSTEESVRVAVVGCGGMGSTHAKRVSQTGHTVVAGADVVEANRNAFGERFGARTYADHDALLENEELDALVVTVPNAFHEPAAVAGLEAGLDVLCEKPLAHTLEAAESIAETANSTEGFCMLGFHSRFSTVASLFETYRDNGAFGDITHVQANYVRRRGIPGIGSWFTDPDLSGGGALIDIGVHALDFALFMLEFPDVVEVSGQTRTDFGHREDYADPDDMGSGWSTDEERTFGVDDSASAFIRCADGTTIDLEAAWAANQKATKRFVARGTEGGAEFEFGGDELTLLDAEAAPVDHYVDTEVRGDREPATHAAAVDCFIDAVSTGEHPEVNTVEQALQVQRILDAIYRSSERGEAVSL